MESSEHVQTRNGKVVRVLRKYKGVYIAFAVQAEQSTFVCKRDETQTLANISAVQVNILQEKHASFAQGILRKILEAEMPSLNGALHISVVFDVYSTEKCFEAIVLAANDVLKELSLSAEYTAEETSTEKACTYTIHRNGVSFHRATLLSHA
ncbi:hypothetical protein NECID01_1187 [Nematocida sp. AWRm77]|nr:hypothetical protein NECID01_1187 [Nematocida sp. AWRm77]